MAKWPLAPVIFALLVSVSLVLLPLLALACDGGGG